MKAAYIEKLGPPGNIVFGDLPATGDWRLAGAGKSSGGGGRPNRHLYSPRCLFP
jgi:hypothetical protein